MVGFLLCALRQHILCRFELCGGDNLAAHDSRKFATTTFMVEQFDARLRFVGLHMLADVQVAVCQRRDLRQMRDAHHLPPLRNLAELSPDFLRRATTDARVDFVKNERRRAVFGSKHGLNRQHHA